VIHGFRCALLALGALSLGAARVEPVQGEAAPAATPPPRFEFPAGTLAERVQRLGADQTPERIEPADLAADWRAPAAFERWRAALAAAVGGAPEAAPSHGEPLARARLALLALAQDRAADAWAHCARAGAEPALLAALLPHFLPGIPSGADAGVGGLPGPLPDGVALAPATPPRTRPIERGRIERRSMRVRGLRVGAAVIGLRVSVEPEGVQVDIEHISGGAALVAVKLPTEPGFALANEYVDWFAAETRGIAHVVEIRPGDEEHTLYGRFEPREETQDFALPPAAPAAVELGGIAVRPEPGAEGRARAEALVRALAGAPLGLAARVVGDADSASGWAGIQVDLRDPATSAAKIAALCGAIERFTLR
jgi:hypothetical protein